MHSLYCSFVVPMRGANSVSFLICIGEGTGPGGNSVTPYMGCSHMHRTVIPNDMPACVPGASRGHPCLLCTVGHLRVVAAWRGTRGPKCGCISCLRVLAVVVGRCVVSGSDSALMVAVCVFLRAVDGFRSGIPTVIASGGWGHVAGKCAILVGNV